MNNSGWILIAVGLVVLVWGVFGFKTRETVIDIGPIHATKETEHNIPYGPVIGGLILLGGVAILVSGRR